MLKKIHIKNYQGHKDTVLDLGPGINSFVGQNDAGKTSIFRSIHWPLTNRPLGNGFIRKNQPNNTEVEIETDTHTISREKGKSINEYRISGVKQPYTSFGSNPPEDVVNILNFNEVNIQSQLELPFLVLSSPGQIAQHIRSISGLDTIDKVSSLLKSKITSNSNLLKNKKEELERKNKKLSVFEKINIKELENLIQNAENLLEENKEIESHNSSLNKIIDGILDVERNWIEFPEDVDITLEEGRKAVENLQNSKKQLDNLNKLLDELVSIDKEILELPEETDVLISKIEPTEKQYNNIRRRIDNLTTILSELSEIEGKEEELEKAVQLKQKEFFELLKQITICPVCTSKLTEETKEKLLGNY